MNQYTYESLEDFLEDINSCPESKRASSVEGDFSFCQTHNIAEAEEISRNGYKELSDVQRKIADVQHFLAQDVEPTHGVSGACVDVGEFVAGVPECMIDFPLVENLRFAHVIVDTGETAGVNSKDMIEKSAAVASLVDKLEGEGMRVRVDIFFGSKWATNNMHSVLVNVKQYKEALSIGQISGCVHPSFLRRLMFLHMEKHLAQVPWGYGTVVNTLTEVRAALEGNLNERDEIIFLPNQRMSGNFKIRTTEEATKWVENFSTNRLDVWTKTNPV